MGRFHHSKKAHSEGRKKKKNKFAAGKTGNKKLDEDFVYTQKHKNIWNSFCNFLDEKIAKEDPKRRRDLEIKNSSSNTSTSRIYPVGITLKR